MYKECYITKERFLYPPFPNYEKLCCMNSIPLPLEDILVSNHLWLASPHHFTGLVFQKISSPSLKSALNANKTSTYLPNSFGHTTIWVICDRLTKYVHFLALPSKYTAPDLARRFSVEISKLHGIPKSIVSDRDPLFLSSFWKELFRVQGTTLRYSTAYHPETDGQSEVVNRCLEAYLRCFTSDIPRLWYKYLHLAEFWHNTSYHSSIKMTPFQALYGRTPPGIPDYLPRSTEIGSL